MSIPFRDEDTRARNRARRRVRSAVALMAVLCGSILPAHAAPQWCTNSVANLWIDSSGNVYVAPNWRGDHVRICNVNRSLATESVATCQAWVSLIQSALPRNAQMVFYYDNAPECAAMPTYGAAPVPGYIMLRN